VPCAVGNLQAALHGAPANDVQTAEYRPRHSCATDVRSCPSVEDASALYQHTALTALTAARVEPTGTKKQKKRQVNITSIAIICLSMTREYCDKNSLSKSIGFYHIINFS